MSSVSARSNPGPGSGAGPDGRTEAHPAGFGTAGRDDEQTGAASNEGCVRVRAVTKCPAQNGDRGQITGSHA